MGRVKALRNHSKGIRSDVQSVKSKAHCVPQMLQPIEVQYGKKKKYAKRTFQEGEWSEIRKLGKTALRKMCSRHGKPMSRAEPDECLDYLKFHLRKTHKWTNFEEPSDDE